jgi:hypothetical protein
MRLSAKQEKKRKRNNAIIGLVLAFLMVFSILAITLDGSGSGNSVVFNDVEFRQKIVFDPIFMQDIYKFYSGMDGGEVQFFFSPFESSSMNVTSDNLSDLEFASTILFSRNPMDEEFEFDANLLFFDVLVSEFNKYSFKPVGYGLTSHTVFEYERGIIDCDSASRFTPVFILSEVVGSQSITEISPYCFEIVGNGENLLRVSDYLLLKVHGVI